MSRLDRALARLRADPAPLLALAAALAAVAYATHASRLYYRNVVDDALVSMQYAKNVALGRGLVFNVGERVEGYTNFLWVAFMAPLYLACRALDADFVPAAVAASVAFAALDVGLVYLIGRQLWGASPLPALLALGMCAVDGGYATWAAMALEGHFLVFWVLLAVWLRGREGPGRRWLWLGLALAAVSLTRPDGALLAVAYGANEAVEALRTRRPGAEPARRARRRGGRARRDGGDAPARATRQGAEPARAARGGEALARAEGEAAGRAREAALALAVWGAVSALHFACRYAYYGDLFPTTYYFKLGGATFDAWARGIAYVKGFFAERAYVPALGALGLLALAHPTARLLALYAGLHLAYVAYVGGDFYAGHRFLVVLVPAFGLLAGAGLDVALRHATGRFAAAGPLADPPTRAAAGLVVASLVAVALNRAFYRNYQTGAVRHEIKRWGAERDRNRRFMRWLAGHKRPGASIATGDVGSAGFFGEFDRVVDLLGVIDPVVARREVTGLGRGQAGHEKWAAPADVVAKRPTYIKIGYLLEDFSPHGYYVWGGVPPEFGVAGLWALDELAERGHFDQARAVHFDARPDGWRAEGDAFADWPSARPRRGQGVITGESGALLNTFHEELGDAATGRLVSAPFPLDADKLVLRVGGGLDPERLRVSLVVDGRAAFSATGRGNEVLARHEWNIAPLRGKTATLEIVDRHAGAGGHLLVDEIVPWTSAGG